VGKGGGGDVACGGGGGMVWDIPYGY
jgi:hypothetical protein